MESTEEESAAISSSEYSQDKQPEHTLEEKLEGLQLDIAQLTEKAKDQTPVIVQNSDPLLKIYQLKENKLKHEIALCKSKSPNVLPKDPDYLENLAKSDLAETISQLKETLTYLKAQKMELQKEKERLKDYLRIDSQIKESLQEKIQSTIDEPLQKDKYLKELEAKNENASRQLKELMNKMGEFLKEHFTAPHSKAHKKNRNPNKFVSLRVIMELLMNKCMDEPNNPWVEVIESYWPPYIELLLRFGIAIRHSNNDNLIKLTPFHL